MRNRAAVLFMVAIFLIPVGFLSTIDEAEASTNTVITGNILGDDDIPIDNAIVLLNWNITSKHSKIWYESETVTNSNGEFTVIIESETFTESEIEGSIIILEYRIGGHTGNGGISKNIKIGETAGASVTESSGVFGVKIENFDDFPIKYVSTPNILTKITVRYDGDGIGNAKITVKNVETKVVMLGTTNESGRYDFRLEPGTYKVTVEKGGFLDWETEDNIELGDSSEVPLDIYLTLAPEKKYWGFDLPHLFAIIGGIMALFLTISVLFYMLWVKRHPGNIRIIDDSPDQ